MKINWRLLEKLKLQSKLSLLLFIIFTIIVWELKNVVLNWIASDKLNWIL